jgi:hypothetical protein
MSAVTVTALATLVIAKLAKVAILVHQHLANLVLILAIAKLANLAAHAVILEAGRHGQKSQVAQLLHLAAQTEQLRLNV